MSLCSEKFLELVRHKVWIMLRMIPNTKTLFYKRSAPGFSTEHSGFICFAISRCAVTTGSASVTEVYLTFPGVLPRVTICAVCAIIKKRNKSLCGLNQATKSDM